MSRRNGRNHRASGAEYPSSDGHTQKAPAAALLSSERTEIARFEAIDGTPLSRITDKQAIPFGYQSQQNDVR